MQLYHIPPPCDCSCHRGAKLFEYLPCCNHQGESWGSEWDSQPKSRADLTRQLLKDENDAIIRRYNESVRGDSIAYE